jgi:hypothetical protein
MINFWVNGFKPWALNPPMKAAAGFLPTCTKAITRDDKLLKRLNFNVLDWFETPKPTQKTTTGGRLFCQTL